jgi:hypothetical protein
VTAGYPLSSSSGGSGEESSSGGSGEERKYFQFHFHDFANLSTTRSDFVASPEFSCNGHQWELWVYPGGDYQATEGKVSAYLKHLSGEAIATSFDVKLIDKFGNKKKSLSTKHEFSASNINIWGWKNFISLSVILDESQNILDSNGTLTIVVSIEEEQTTVYVPKNPFANMMQKIFNDEATADVCFEVSNADQKKGKRETRKTKTTTPFYAHRLILENCAPMLAAICGSNDGGGIVTASVNDIKPDIFLHLLSYVYGGSVPEEELKTHAKDIIDAANKYSIVNLKLTAEAAYVESTDINMENAMDNLLYADSKNCELLKEAVMNFFAENHFEAAANIYFTDCPGHVMSDLLVAFGRNSKKGKSGANVDELDTLCVSALRRKLHKMGLDVDGSREAMIESIKRQS